MFINASHPRRMKNVLPRYTICEYVVQSSDFYVILCIEDRVTYYVSSVQNQCFGPKGLVCTCVAVLW
jgi:hypothetical protein